MYTTTVFNDSKPTMLGGRLFQTLIIRSLKMFSHINTTIVDEQLSCLCGYVTVRLLVHVCVCFSVCRSTTRC